KGYYVVGPKDDFPNPAMSSPNPTIATLRVKDQAISTTWPNSYPKGVPYMSPAARSNMSYVEPQTYNFLGGMPKCTLLLQRLCCPGLPYNPIPGAPAYEGTYDPNLPVNPYITVDYIENVPVNDGVQYDTIGSHTNAPPSLPPEQRSSAGRNQPFAADKSQKVDQKTQAAPAAPQPPQHTLFQKNIQGGTPGNPAEWPYDWLTFMDRPLV